MTITRNSMNRTLRDTAQAIALEQPLAAIEAAAAERVRRNLAAATTDAAAGDAPLAESAVGTQTLSSCADYQALMPALVAGTLPEAQRLLVEDHGRECIPCRKHLQAVRAGRPVADSSSGPAAPARVGRYYAAAAAVAAVAVAGVWLSQRVLLPPQDGILQVQSVDGRMFLAGSGGSSDLVPLLPGDAIDGGDRVRTGAGSRAVFELADGSRIEAAGLTAFRVNARRRGHRVRVDRGSVIVQAAKQENGSLIVSTEEMLVSVKGTIFAVTHGVKGSRVSVIEGEVEVEQGRKRHSLLAGDQLRSRPTLVALALEEEVGWSQDADHYVALLQEFKSLRSELNQLMEAAPVRYSTRLLDLMPSDTTVYLAMPNASATLSDMYELVRSRLESSELLSEWWAELVASGVVDTIDELVGNLDELGDAMGDETVVAFAGLIGAETATPLLVTEVTDAEALREALEGHIEDLLEGGDEDPIRILDDLDSATDSDGELLVWIADDIAAASTSLATLRTVAASMDGATNSARTGNAFVGSRLHGRLAERYAAGAELLGAVDLATLLSGLDDDDGDDADVLAFTGLDKVQDLVVSRTQDRDRADVTATLSFDGARSGAVSWLAEPGANGALEFFSPDASFVSAGVIEDPLTIYDQVADILAERGVDLDVELVEVEAEFGLSLRNDFLVHLGGEYAVGIDGPVLPTPAWKAVASIYDAGKLQSSIETLVEKAAELLAEHDEDANASLTLEEHESNGRTVYRLGLEIDDADEDADGADESDDRTKYGSDGGLEGLLETPEIFYTYFDGYMVSASSIAAIDTAIRYRGSDASLVDSQEFIDLLPANGYTDFSAMVYNRLAETAGELLGMLPTGAVDDDQQAVVQAIEESISSYGPSLYTVYAGRSEIVVTSSGPSLLAFSGLSQLLGLGAFLDRLESDTEDAAEPELEPAAAPGTDTRVAEYPVRSGGGIRFWTLGAPASRRLSEENSARQPSSFAGGGGRYAPNAGVTPARPVPEAGGTPTAS